MFAPTPRSLTPLLAAALAAPLVIAVIVLRDPRWFPSLDWAQLELRVRDVGAGHTPLIGLPGRFGGFGVRGSHPGPLAFYALAPLYRLLGGSSWALVVATAALSCAAVIVVLWIARRIGGGTVMLTTAASLALLMHAYGPQRLAIPWNPWLPVLWWFAFLFACWAILRRDDAMLPVAVVCGSFCAQTHIPYAPIASAVLTFIAVAVVVDPQRRRDGQLRRARARWGGFALALLLLLWAPPIIDEIVHSPGNLSILRAHFTEPVEPAAGFEVAARTVLVQLDVTALVTGNQRTRGSVVPGLIALAAWSGAAAWTMRHHRRDLIALHAIVAVALVAGLLAMSRVLGHLWDYLVLWHWGTTALLVLAIVLSAAAAIPPLGRIGAGACVAVMAAAIAATGFDAAHVEPTLDGLSKELDGLVPVVLEKLDPSREYAIDFDDRYHVGSGAFALLLELERAGINAGLPPAAFVEARPWGVLDPDETTEQIVFVTSMDAIERWRALRHATELAHFEPSSGDRRAARRARETIERSLRDDGNLLDLFEANVFGFAVTPTVPADLRELAAEMLDLPFPASVFLVSTASSQ